MYITYMIRLGIAGKLIDQYVILRLVTY